MAVTVYINATDDVFNTHLTADAFEFNGDVLQVTKGGKNVAIYKHWDCVVEGVPESPPLRRAA
jgi:hypothetical protein